MKTHCKPKPCKAYRELPVSQFSQGKTCFHYREPCSHYRDPVVITGISLQNSVLPCTRLQCRGPPTVPLTQILRNPVFSSPKNLHKVGTLCTKLTIFLNYRLYLDMLCLALQPLQTSQKMNLRVNTLNEWVAKVVTFDPHDFIL